MLWSVSVTLYTTVIPACHLSHPGKLIFLKKKNANVNEWGTIVNQVPFTLLCCIVKLLECSNQILLSVDERVTKFSSFNSKSFHSTLEFLSSLLFSCFIAFHSYLVFSLVLFSLMCSCFPFKWLTIILKSDVSTPLLKLLKKISMSSVASDLRTYGCLFRVDSSESFITMQHQYTRFYLHLH